MILLYTECLFIYFIQSDPAVKSVDVRYSWHQTAGS
jgi:hypothetical protein